jgi:hypothetical protein
MIDQRRERDAHLANDLRPQMQRVAGVAPRRKRQIGPLRIVAHRFVSLGAY